MATTTIELGDAHGNVHKFKHEVDGATGALVPMVDAGAGSTTTLEQGDAHGNVHKFKYAVDADGVTLTPVVSGAAASGGGGGSGTLTTAKTVYVSAAGNDANAGTIGAPFLTFARALQDRQQYSAVDGVAYTIQFVGAGPFASPLFIRGLRHLNQGKTLVRGARTAEVVHASGTASGDFAGMTLPTSTGLGADVHRERWLRITNGACAGLVFKIAEHTDNSVTVLNGYASYYNAAPVAAGNTFQIISPGTDLAGHADNTIVDDCWGLRSSWAEPCLQFEDLVMSGNWNLENCSVALLLVRNTGRLALFNSVLATRTDVGGPYGLPDYAYSSVGLHVAGSDFSVFGGAVGELILYATAGVYIQHNSAVMVIGARFTGAVEISDSGILRFNADGIEAIRVDKTIQVKSGRVLCTGPGGGIAKFAVAAGSCFRVKHDGVVICHIAWTGGTTDAAGFAVDVRDGGKFLTSLPVTHTGGTANQDLRTQNVTAARTVLSAAGIAAGNAADSLLGEVIARVGP